MNQFLKLKEIMEELMDNKRVMGIETEYGIEDVKRNYGEINGK
jgi:hypothetical protein